MLTKYPCPSCGTCNAMHGHDCIYEEKTRVEIERAYIDIISRLMTRPASEDELKASVNDEWCDLHDDVMSELLKAQIVTVSHEQEFELSPPDVARDDIDPKYDPLATIFEYGSVPGAHDNAIFALISFYESQGLNWTETKERVIDWLEETGAWERGGFKEASPAKVLAKKRHVYDGPGNGDGYGWKRRAREAKEVIDRHRETTQASDPPQASS